jgi:hypothetical protein
MINGLKFVSLELYKIKTEKFYYKILNHGRNGIRTHKEYYSAQLATETASP